MHYSWPGNIRELRNVIERIIVTSEGKEIISAAKVLGIDISTLIRKKQKYKI